MEFIQPNFSVQTKPVYPQWQPHGKQTITSCPCSPGDRTNLLPLCFSKTRGKFWATRKRSMHAPKQKKCQHKNFSKQLYVWDVIKHSFGSSTWPALCLLIRCLSKISTVNPLASAGGAYKCFPLLQGRLLEGGALFKNVKITFRKKENVNILLVFYGMKTDSAWLYGQYMDDCISQHVFKLFPVSVPSRGHNFL